MVLTWSSHNRFSLYRLSNCQDFFIKNTGNIRKKWHRGAFTYLLLPRKSNRIRVIGDYPRRTPIPYLHSTLSLEFIHTFIYRLTEKFFQNCTTHSNPLISQIGNYSLPDLLAQYTKYTHKRTKHLLLYILPNNRSVFYIVFILHCCNLYIPYYTQMEKIQEVLL
jgi:hypothetical protein